MNSWGVLTPRRAASPREYSGDGVPQAAEFQNTDQERNSGTIEKPQRIAEYKNKRVRSKEGEGAANVDNLPDREVCFLRGARMRAPRRKEDTKGKSHTHTHTHKNKETITQHKPLRVRKHSGA